MSEAEPRWVWVVEDDDDTSYMTVFERLDTQGRYEGVPICRLQGEQAAALITEVGTVHHQTGLTPSQLVERVKELEEVARALVAYDEAEHEDHVLLMLDYADMLKAARAALSKALPNTVAEVK